MTTPNFKDLLSKPADAVKPPPPLPAGSYQGTVKEYKFGETKPKDDKLPTPYLEVTIQLTAPGDDIAPEDLADIDLSKKTFRQSFYLTEDALFRLTQFMTSMGISLSGRSVAECIPDILHQPVLVYTTLRPNPKNPEQFFVDVADLKGVS